VIMKLDSRMKIGIFKDLRMKNRQTATCISIKMKQQKLFRNRFFKGLWQALSDFF
jgi:hypothetical protein